MVASSEESADVPSMTMAETATSEDEYESAMSDNWLDVITGVEGFDFSVELFLDESSLFLSLALSDVFFLALDLNPSCHHRRNPTHRPRSTVPMFAPAAELPTIPCYG